MRATSFSIFALILGMPLTSIAKDKPRVARKSPALTGTYSLKRSKGAVGSLLVRQLSSNSIEFELECNRGAPSYNSGMARATIDVIDGIAVYRISEFGGPCEIKLTFTETAVSVSQSGIGFECGFGHGVYCGGTYRLRNRKPPKFTER